ncbi:hypothetical protein [Rhodanobacter umsongensis]
MIASILRPARISASMSASLMAGFGFHAARAWRAAALLTLARPSRYPTMNRQKTVVNEPMALQCIAWFRLGMRRRDNAIHA